MFIPIWLIVLSLIVYAAYCEAVDKIAIDQGKEDSIPEPTGFDEYHDLV